MNKIIGICNNKGGVEKTTISLCLAGAFAEMDLKVLLVDMDQPHLKNGRIKKRVNRRSAPSGIVLLHLAGLLRYAMNSFPKTDRSVLKAESRQAPGKRTVIKDIPPR